MSAGIALLGFERKPDDILILGGDEHKYFPFHQQLMKSLILVMIGLHS